MRLVSRGRGNNAAREPLNPSVPAKCLHPHAGLMSSSLSPVQRRWLVAASGYAECSPRAGSEGAVPHLQQAGRSVDSGAQRRGEVGLALLL